jgi:putative membrane protein
MLKKWIRYAALAAVCGLPLSGRVAFAQAVAEPATPAQQPAQDRAERDRATDRINQDQERIGTARRGGEAHGQIDDRTLAALLLIGNQKEIALGRFGVARSQNPEVKQFAQQMVQDHGQFLSKLAQAAGARERAPGAAEEGAGAAAGKRDAARRPEANRTPGLDGAKDLARADGAPRAEWQRFELGNSPLVAFDREVAEQCLQSAEQFLGKQQGPEFDRWFVALQLVEHMGMRDKLKVAEKHATGELRQVIEQGLQTTEQHLQQAEQVMRQLAQASGTPQRTGARPGGATKQ